MRNATRICLLNPGPVTLSDRVRQALLGPDLCHRQTEFAALQAEVRHRLARVYDTHDDYSAVLFTGSGTAAVEAMVGSLMPRDGKALVVANGVYGERIASMLAAHGKPHEVISARWTEPMSLDRVEQRLAGDNDITHVIAVQHETTTGRLNDIAALGAICRRHDIPLLLDMVSSFGGERIDFDAWNVQACAATSNKCLHGVPGVSFVLARRDVLENQASAAPTLYLDLISNYRAQQDGFPQFTPAVQTMYALREALCELKDQGGWAARQRHYQTLSELVRSNLREQGVEMLLDGADVYSASLSSFQLPTGMAFDELYDGLSQHGFIIYSGQRALYETIFRIAVMGDLMVEDMQRFCAAFATVIRTNPRSQALPGNATVLQAPPAAGEAEPRGHSVPRQSLGTMTRIANPSFDVDIAAYSSSETTQ